MSDISQLAKLQADFQAYLVDEQALAEFNNHGITISIISDAKVGIKRRLGIYYDAYRLRIIEALANSYPKLKDLLGDDLFDATARSYINAYPSMVRNMRWVGDSMQTHLINTLPQHPIAAEMAAFEWALGLAFDAEDAPVLSLQDLAAIAPENWGDLHFKFHPAVQLLNPKYNVLLIWQALNIGETPPKATQINEPCVVWREDLNAHYRSLEHAEYAAIESVILGTSFGELCESLQENASEDEATMQAAQYLSSWLNGGLITAIID